jgi:hypothetical protein
MDYKSFYLASDIDYSLDLFRAYVSFIERNWNNIPGRPTIIFLITKELFGKNKIKKHISPRKTLKSINCRYFLDAHESLNSQLINTIKKLNSGYINGAR